MLTTQNYTYNSQNQRTDLSFDVKGNLTSHNGYTLDWNDKGKLSGATKNGSTISYVYNYDGIRTSKTVNGTTTNFTLDDNNNVIQQTTGTNIIKFVYDSSNSPVYLIYNNTTYYYEKNLQGDVIGLVDSDGNSVVQYSYDVLGKLLTISGSLSSTLGSENPLRYRGYYYDIDTSLYYLQSRYYSPDLMQFICQDDPVFSNAQGQPLGSNLYIYCLNNPVMNYDPTGNDAIWLQNNFGVGAVHGAGLTSLLIQDNRGAWWHFYWGPQSFMNWANGATLDYIGKFTSLGALNNFLNNTCRDKNKKNPLYSGKYDNYIYFKGNFTSTLSNAKSMISSKRYCLFGNNCMQVSARLLMKGSFSVSDGLYKTFLGKMGYLNFIPNLAWSKMVMFNSAISVWNKTSWWGKPFLPFWHNPYSLIVLL